MKKTLKAELQETQEQLTTLERKTESLEPYVLAGELAMGYLHDENSTLSMLALYLTLILKQLDMTNPDRRKLRELIREVADTVDIMQARHNEMWLMVREREQWIPLPDCVRNCVSLVRSRLDRQRITLTKRISPEAGKIKVPFQLWRTVLVYLLWDCLGTRLNRGGQVIIDAVLDRDALVLAVRDVGRGRDADVITDLQGLGDLHHHGGLGLWFVKRAIDRLGATITLENHVEAGAKFVIRAPLNKVRETNENDSVD